eukprot:6021478-Pleurochrysis_carterae.AAC.1
MAHLLALVFALRRVEHLLVGVVVNLAHHRLLAAPRAVALALGPLGAHLRLVLVLILVVVVVVVVVPRPLAPLLLALLL